MNLAVYCVCEILDHKVHSTSWISSMSTFRGHDIEINTVTQMRKKSNSWLVIQVSW